MSEPVLFSRQGAVARLTLNRPEAGNAIDLAMATSLAEAATRCAADPKIRCVVLTGAGRLFCTGGDVVGFAAAGSARSALLDDLAETVHRAVLSLASMPKPLVTQVNGPAAGAGLSLAILGDVALAARSAHFTPAYSSVGLTPDGGMTWLLPRLVGLRRAQDMLLTNRRIAAEEAETMGLVSRLCEDDGLEEAVDILAGRLAASAVEALDATRQLLGQSLHTDLAAQLDAERRAIVAAGARAECEEGVRAFLERRKPQFQGERSNG